MLTSYVLARDPMASCRMTCTIEICSICLYETLSAIKHGCSIRWSVRYCLQSQHMRLHLKLHTNKQKWQYEASVCLTFGSGTKGWSCTSTVHLCFLVPLVSVLATQKRIYLFSLENSSSLQQHLQLKFDLCNFLSLVWWFSTKCRC